MIDRLSEGEEPFVVSDDVAPGKPLGAPRADGARLPRRILVAGSSGAGKSTLARALARRLGIPYTEIDSLFHGPNWAPRETFVEDVTAIALSNEWVMEWQYSSVQELLLERAELLVCLDYSRPVVTSRVVRRTLRRSLRREELWNGNREPSLRSIVTDPDHVVRWSWSTFERNRALMRDTEARDDLERRVVRLTTPRATRRWLDSAVPDSGAPPVP
jgi:adenylate kinase family enzyme